MRPFRDGGGVRDPMDPANGGLELRSKESRRPPKVELDIEEIGDPKFTGFESVENA